MALTNKPKDPAKAAAIKAQRDEIKEAGEFDIAAFVSGFEPPLSSVVAYRKASLLPDLERLERLIDAETQREEEGRPATYSEGRALPKLLRDYEALCAEFEASAVEFRFRPLNPDEAKAASEEIKKAGLEEQSAEAACYALARCCVSHPNLTVENWQDIRRNMTDLGFAPVVNAFWQAMAKGGQATAPFSRRSWPGPITTEQ